MEFDNKIKLLHQNNEEEHTGSIVKISDDGLLAKFEDNDSLILNTKIHLVLFHMTMGEMYYEAQIHDVYKKHVFFINLKYLSNVQRRTETRAKYQVKLMVDTVYCNDQEICLHKKALLETIDLSANGIQLSSETDFPANIIFSINLPIDGENISCDAAINRKTKKEERYFYGCALLVSEHLRNKIRRYVFRLQLEERKRQKEKEKYNEKLRNEKNS